MPATVQEPPRERQRSQGWGSCQPGEIKTAPWVINCIRQQFRNWTRWPIYRDKPFPECQQQTTQQSSIHHTSLATSILLRWKAQMKCITWDPRTGDLGIVLTPSHTLTHACWPPPPRVCGCRGTWHIQLLEFPCCSNNSHKHTPGQGQRQGKGASGALLGVLVDFSLPPCAVLNFKLLQKTAGCSRG